ncbi:hypothetical protein [Mycobacterium sp. 1465703.0]|uniref:hypothetical protein n=1 Tax=Mycobacterium sp. 1465703.0 TaxID=1834078 RepID=UPI0035192A69
MEPNRVILWGISLGGGHVITVAAQRRDLAAVIALTPLVDGWRPQRWHYGTAARRRWLAAHGPVCIANCRPCAVATRSPSRSSRRRVATGPSISAAPSTVTRRWPDLRGATGSTRQSDSNSCATVLPAAPGASRARHWCKSATTIAAHRRAPRPSPRPKPVRRRGTTVAITSTHGPAARISPRLPSSMCIPRHAVRAAPLVGEANDLIRTVRRGRRLGAPGRQRAGRRQRPL